ncbi:MAG: hypothetical protein ACNA8P_02150 [Phycisphaerales bacterium]
MTEITVKADREKLTTRQRLVVELIDRLRRAEAVLRSLQEAKQEADRQAQELKRADAMKAVTGFSGIERAIQATSRMIDLIKREMGEARATLSQSEARRLEDLGTLSLVG